MIFSRLYNVQHINLQINPELSLASFIPESVNQWDSERNGNLQPSQIPYNYDGYVWWKCPHGHDHIWKTRCKNRVDRENRSLHQCPFCSNRRVSQTNSLLTRYPSLASEFDMVSNKGLKASDVVFNRRQAFYWRCIHNHVYKMTIQKRLQYMEDNETSCPFCRLQDHPSTLLYDYNSELFEESYNWLNCPSLPPPVNGVYFDSIPENGLPEDFSTHGILPEDLPNHGILSEDLPNHGILPDDLYKPIDFQKLYTNTEGDNPKIPSTSSPLNMKGTPSAIDQSIQRSIQNHILEYQIWKESLQWNDKRIIWWVCNHNPNHIWRESVRSRIGKACPFCYRDQMSSSQPSSDDSIVTF